MRKGFTLIEMLVAVSITMLIAAIVVSGFSRLRSSQTLDKDTDTVVELLRQARSQTLTSQNASVYGVHFATNSVTLFTGSTYSSGTASNQVFTLSGPDSVLTITLTGGGSDVIFNRLNGETAQNGTIVISATSISKTHTVTIYKTGLVQFQ